MVCMLYTEMIVTPTPSLSITSPTLTSMWALIF